MGRSRSTNGEKRNASGLLVVNPEGKRPLRRLRRVLMDNNKINLGETGLGGMDWIYLAQDSNQWRALVSTVMNLQVL
jgi:hypothetical protein